MGYLNKYYWLTWISLKMVYTIGLLLDDILKTKGKAMKINTQEFLFFAKNHWSKRMNGKNMGISNYKHTLYKQ